MARLFVALEIGSLAQDLVAAEQARLSETMRSRTLRWTKHDQLHITLVFIGEVAEERGAHIVEGMRTPLLHSPFQFELGGLGAFPPHGPPRALWIGVKSGANAVISVQSLVAERLEQLGVQREKRPFSPHLTLARWRESRPSDRPRAAAGSPPTIARVSANAVTLFQSRVTSDGSTYTRLVECSLGEGGGHR